MSVELVKLEWYECEQAISVGGRREVESMRHMLQHAPHCIDGKSAIHNHIESAGAERAVAKCLNLDWHASINCFRNGVADVGRAIEVRWRRNKWDLIVRANDSDDRAFVLVRGEMPEYELVGWIWGREAKQPSFVRNYGGYGEAWFVPDRELKPISKLAVNRVRLEETGLTNASGIDDRCATRQQSMSL